MSHTAELQLRAQEDLHDSRQLDSAITFWSGTSGYEYVHTVYDLLHCPPVPDALVVLVRADSEGRHVLRVMCVEQDCPTLNLAQIRQAGAVAGANEVHLHFVPATRRDRHIAAFDIETLHGDVAVVGKS